MWSPNRAAAQKLGSLVNSFRCALAGLLRCVVGERNLRIHLCATVAVLWLGLRLGLDAPGLALLLLACGMVITAELLNTATEAVTDFFARDYHPVAKVAKDVAAGAVLVSALFAVGVGLLLLWQPSALLALGGEFAAAPAQLLGPALFLCAALAFVFLPPTKELPKQVGEKLGAPAPDEQPKLPQ